MKISKCEKQFIKSYVNLKFNQWFEITENDAQSLEYYCTQIIGNSNIEYRYLVEDFIKIEINKIIK